MDGGLPHRPGRCTGARAAGAQVRPRGGGLAAPRGRMPLRATPWLLALIVALGILLLLFGVSLLLVLAFDQLAVHRLPALTRILRCS